MALVHIFQQAGLPLLVSNEGEFVNFPETGLEVTNATVFAIQETPTDRDIFVWNAGNWANGAYQARRDEYVLTFTLFQKSKRTIIEYRLRED